MKVIDLLNKIANGEEVPKKIKWHGVTFWIKENDYFNDIDFSLFRHDDEYSVLDMLNDEVEIIEEKKIPEKLSTWFSLEQDCENDNIQYANNNFKTMYEKINEIYDYFKNKGE